jgi:predicted phosphodiesterase
MKSTFFSDMMSHNFNPAAVLDISAGAKVLIMSDLHMGDGGRGDDLLRNADLVMDCLSRYYLPGGWHLVLNGDIEELQGHEFPLIWSFWRRLYEIFDHFAGEGRLYKTLGNHDEDLVRENHYPYPLYDAVRIETGILPVCVYHGHQSSRIYTTYNHLIRAGVRYVFKPMGLRNMSSARSPRKRFHVEKQAYEFSLANNLISVIGHTHRALFESLGRFDYIKFEIERLCREYPASAEEEKQRIARDVHSLQIELGKLKKSEKRRSLKESLYGDEFPVPCLFNSGCAIGKKGITAIELTNRNIALVYWFTEGRGKKFVSRGGYNIETLEGTSRRRTVLNEDNLDYVKAKIALLGNSPDSQEESHSRQN